MVFISTLVTSNQPKFEVESMAPCMPEQTALVKLLLPQWLELHHLHTAEPVYGRKRGEYKNFILSIWLSLFSHCFTFSKQFNSVARHIDVQYLTAAIWHFWGLVACTEQIFGLTCRAISNIRPQISPHYACCSTCYSWPSSTSSSHYCFLLWLCVPTSVTRF